jgi:hypothetical protein
MSRTGHNYGTFFFGVNLRTTMLSCLGGDEASTTSFGCGGEEQEAATTSGGSGLDEATTFCGGGRLDEAAATFGGGVDEAITSFGN